MKQSKFTPPSLIKSTLSESAKDNNIISNQKIATNQDIACPVTLSNPSIICNSAIPSNLTILSNAAILCDSAALSDPATPSDPATFDNLSMFSSADDVMLMSPSKSKGVHVNNSTPTASNPTEVRATAVIAVMRGNPQDGYTSQHSNRHYKQKIVWILLDSGSDGELIFVNKDKPMLLPNSKRLVPQSWNTLNEIYQTRCKAWAELSFFYFSDSK
jgi:hypothetical protein